MKKIILIAAMALGFVVTAVAANPLDKATGALEKTFGGKARSIGIRNTEISYQHSFDNNFIQLDFGFIYPNVCANEWTWPINSLNITATYNWMLLQLQWTDRGEWGVYAGPGASVGFGFCPGIAGFNVSAVGLVGLEYRFWFPLQLSVEWRPQLGFQVGKGINGFFYDFYPAIGVRYSF